ncbi:MAG: signal peptide peptidase SppA [Nibricoccus sp.]
MKNFFTSMLGTLAALAVCAMGAFIIGLIMLGMLIAIGNKKPASVEQGAYLVFDLTTLITDAPPEATPSELLSALGSGDQGPRQLQLRQVTAALRAAGNDSRIAGVYLHGHLPSGGGSFGNGFAALKEVREALVAVKAKGKPVVAYLDVASTRDMYVSSVANELMLDPYGIIYMPGLGAEPMFYTGAFEKFGIGVQVTRVGKYKSAVEPFTRKDLSPENREQLQKLLDDVWGELVEATADARGLSKADLQAIVDREGFIRADAALAAKLVTRVSYRDEALDELKTRTGLKGVNKPFKQIALAEYIDLMDGPHMAKPSSGGKIAVVYAEGVIVDGNGQQDEIGGTRFARELRRLRQDNDVKAIVLRVNSPGGSASASEHIQREVRLAKQVKPVIVSMGSYAASGGYWISTYGDKIYAEPTTITGSIGVFGLMMNVQKLAGNLGLTFDRVKTGKYADSMTISRPKTEEELALIQRAVDWIYSEFITKVSQSRGLELSRVQEIAQGRVWSGVEAKNLGLVDEIGGLDAAIAFAAEKAGLGNKYQLIEYPAHKEFAEMIAELFNGIKPASSRGGAITTMVDAMKDELRSLEQFNDQQGVYARLPVDIRLK